MKVAMLQVDLPNESRGGVAHQAHGLSNALVERRHQVTVFTGSPTFPDCRYAVHSYGFAKIPKRLRSFLFAWKVNRTDFSAFDIVHALGDNYLLTKVHPQVRTFSGSAKSELKSARSFRRKIFQTIMIGLEERGARIADLNVGISESTRLDLPRVTRIVPCGVDLAQFTPGKKAAKPTILFVGTMNGRKRGDLLLATFLNNIRTVLPEAELWVVADQELRVEGVTFYSSPSTELLAGLFRQAWVFCLPSTYEGFGVPYVEAMASGTAIVASPNPGAQEVLNRGEYGSIVADADLGDEILRLLKDHPARRDLERRGLERAAEYSWSSVAEKYEHLYETLTSAGDVAESSLLSL